MEPMGEVNGSPDDIYRGGTIGSMGGGSVFGAISIGGAGGWSSGALIDNANIRTGSNISGNYVIIKNCLKKSLILSSPIPVRSFVTMESFVHHPKRFMLDKEGRFLF